MGINESIIWQTVIKTCNKVFQLPLNRRAWLWFKSYLMDSVLLYQTIENTKEQKENENEKETKMLYSVLIESTNNN